MQGAPITQQPPQKLKLKERKSQILEEIRKFLGIPDIVPNGGLEFQKELKKIGPKRLRMAMDPILPLYNEFFKGEFTLQKLYRWAENNGKIHKSSLMQSEEIKQHVLEVARKNLDQGLLKKSLQVELAQVIGQDDPSFVKIKVSKSSVSRWMKADREHDFQQGCKKVKTDVNPHEYISPVDISTQQHSPENEVSCISLKQLMEFPFDNYLDVEAFNTKTDAWASSDCRIAMEKLLDDLQEIINRSRNNDL